MKAAVLRAQICLERWQHDRLKAISKQTGKPMSQIVRECLTKVLGQPDAAKGKPPSFRFIGSGKGTGEAVAEHHDDYLYGK